MKAPALIPALLTVAAGAAQGLSAQAVRLDAELPRVMVFLDEHGETAAVRFASFLREAGFTVLDPAFARTAADRDLARAAVGGDDDAATRLGRSLGAQVIVVGAAPAQDQPSPSAPNLTLGNATVAVRALRLDDRRVISEQTAPGVGLDATPQAARAKAVGQAAQEILYRTGFIGTLVVDWERHPWDDAAYWEPSPGAWGGSTSADTQVQPADSAYPADRPTAAGDALRIAILESDAYPERGNGPAARSIEIVGAERRIARVRGVVTPPVTGVTVGRLPAIVRPLTADETATLGVVGGTWFQARVPLGPDDRRVRVSAQGAAGEASVEVTPEIGERWAVVVGISRYADRRITPLEYAAADARAMADFLRSPDGGSVPEENVRVLVDEEATSEALREALFVFLQQAAPEDLVTVYVAAQGSPDPLRASNLYLLTYDTDVDAMAATAFPMWDVKTALRRHIASERVVVIADACRSGGALVGEANPIGGAFSELFDPSRRVTLSAAGVTQLSFEDARWGGGHGVFTYFLLEGLRGAADQDGDGVVTFREAATFVAGKVAAETSGA